jgi:Holliday junction resolvasome RuvABC DNA-binding subunit
MLNDSQMLKLEKKLAELASQDPEIKRPTTRKAIFEKYKTQILNLIELGHKAESIKDVLESVGVKMTVSTVEQYIRGINRAGGNQA